VLGEEATLETLSTYLQPMSLRAGWNKVEPSLWDVPRTNFKPAVWRWKEAREALATAGRLISTDLADRRNLVLVNPTKGNHYATLRTLVSAYQMIQPGERARSHRHTPNALRLILEGVEDVYTVVEGKRVDMKPGDVVLTPSWFWHGHANDGSAPSYWIDYLDVPLVHQLEPMFFEPWPGGFQEPESLATDEGWVFDWQSTLNALDAARPDERGRYGYRVELGQPALPTIALHMQRLDGGFNTEDFGTTANQIFTAVTGCGRTVVEGETFEWSRGDIVVVPTWHAFHHEADEESVLLSVSDEPALRALGFHRESSTVENADARC
jgi:gentisate 1,2-dioxygenase